MDKQANREPFSANEKKDLEKLRDTMRPYIPYDRNHPGYDSLTPAE